MPIDLSAVNWAYVGILSLIAFVAALLGSLISFRNRLMGAVIAGVLFAVAFVYWTYYPHPNIPGPISLDLSAPVSATGPATTSPAPARAPANPVSTVSPAPAATAPANPVTTMSPPPASPGAK
jgi:hypothetical protein